MRGSSILYFIKEGFRNLWVNRLMSFASIGILAACLLLMGNAVLLSMNIAKIVNKIQEGNEIVGFLKDGLSQEQITDVGSRLKNVENISEIIYVSPEDALMQWQERLGENKGLLEGYEQSNNLPPSYRILIKDPGKLDVTLYQLKEFSEFQKINDFRDLAVKLHDIKNMITFILLWIILLMLAVSMFIIVNTIKLAMYIRKREINIMKFVGATNWFIRWPFLIEGLILGMISGVLSFFLQWYMYQYIVTNLLSIVNIVDPILFSSILPFVLSSMILIGVFIGSIGSAISIRKYLKV